MSISSVIGKYAVKAAGAAGIGILAYDAHKKGRHHGIVNRNKKDCEALDYYWNNSRNLTTVSTVNAKLKDKLFKWELDNNFRGFINKGIGYVEGFASMVVDDIIPWGLATTALLVKGTKKIPAPTATDPHAVKKVMTTRSKAAGIALGAYTAFAFLKNVCGFGLSDK